MVKSKRFEPIASLARDSEREAAKALGNALCHLDEQVQRMEQLIAYRADYNQRLNASGSNGMKGQQLNEYLSFLSKLSTAIEQQELAIKQARQELEEKKRFWFARRGRSKALDAVLDKYIQNERKQLEKREQRELDDRNNRPKSD
jgi:flagellar FliJ protein